MLKNGENRQYDTRCPFDCTKWEECVCENTAIRDGKFEPSDYFHTAEEINTISDRAETT